MGGRSLSEHQQVVARNRLFVLVPSLILVLLLALLGWEVVRANVDEAARGEWPWRLTFLGVAPAASLAGVFGGLLLARGQFARSVRPVIGWTGDWEPEPGATDQQWVVRVYNGGSGLGVVRYTWYAVTPSGGASGDTSEDWLPLDAARNRLSGAGLSPGRDFSLIQLGVGHPLPSSTKPKDGYVIFRLTEPALPRLAALDVRLGVADMVGDVHERHLQLLKGAAAELVPAAAPTRQEEARRRRWPRVRRGQPPPSAETPP